MKKLLITGGAGFIGSNFVRYVVQKTPDYQVTVLDKLTYAGNLANLDGVLDGARVRFVQGDICDPAIVDPLVREHDAVVNFAAETHVDRSLLNPGAFVQTDVFGTYVLLEACRRAGGTRMVQVSTDEVYGDVLPGTQSLETDRLNPRSPYSASKGGGDLQCLGFFHTYQVPVSITRAANTVGPFQYPEKLVPLMSTNAILGLPLPVYGDGQQVRDWLHASDHCAAIDLVLHRGTPGEVYNVGVGYERPNIEVVELILTELGAPRSLIRHVADRQGHDRRYSLNCQKVRALGWSPTYTFERCIRETARWYAEHRPWWGAIRARVDFQSYYQQNYEHRLQPAAPPA
ncbi:MAG: dTDP-glucose 4,6-dehydratase [Chloroflexi bacterium]|nr:dTDP-glucose 4,6-dehydratase [Chloroflexota bacterium]